MEITGAKDKACYAALKIGGRFGHLLKMEGKQIGMRRGEDDGDECGRSGEDAPDCLLRALAEGGNSIV